MICNQWQALYSICVCLETDACACLSTETRMQHVADDVIHLADDNFDSIDIW